MTQRLTRICSALPLLASFLVGCGGGDSLLTSNDTLLRYVPADTPYVLAAVEPLPDDYVDMYTQYMESVGEMIQLGMQSALEEMGAAGSPDAVEAFDLLTELTSPETIAAIGINRDSTYAIYGVGLLPVMRVTLAEDNDIKSVLDRIESLIENEGGVDVVAASVGGLPYRYFGDDEARLIIAQPANELVVTMVPASFGDAELQSVLGADLPNESIADSGRLAEIADEYGFTSHMVALMDIERLTAKFLDTPSNTDAVLLDLMGYDAGELSAVCRNEIRSLAGAAPSIVSGYTALDSDAMEMNLVVELREDIAQGLASIPASVRGLGAATDALMSFGMSFDIPAVRAFANARLDAIEADPFECESFADLQQAVPLGRLYLSQPLPPFVDSLKGFAATMDFNDIDFAAIDSMPTDMEASVLIASSDVQGLLAMASALDPTIASLNLTTDGQITPLDLPVPFNDPSVNPFGDAYFVATDSEMGVGLGENGEVRLGELMSAPASDPSTFMAMSLDLGAYYGLMADTIENAAVLDLAGDPQMAVIGSMTDMMRGMQDVFSRETVDIQFTDRGIEMPIRLELAP